MGEPGKKLPHGLPQIGQIVMDRYRVERLVGTGGMAHVLAAKHVTLDQEVAIKILDPFLISDQDARERFAREARAMATLTSKYTVRVYDVGAMPNGLPFMVMELLTGHDLHQELQRRGPLPLAEAVEYMEQVCQAVAEAHSQGIIHRDLKPQNLFLTKVKGKPVVRVLDFGIARINSAGIKVETITRMGDVVGTLQYMSPEQIKSSKSVDPRSDVWALGACLYKLITGWPPYPQAGEAPLMSAILTSAPKPLTDYRKDVPAILTSVIARCLRREPAERFPNANELRKALEEVMLFFANDNYDEKTDVMPSAVQQKATAKVSSDPRLMMGGTMALPEAPVPADSGRRSVPADFNKTIPLNSPSMQHVMAEHAAMQRERDSSSQMPRPLTPSQPMQPISSSHGPISRPPVSKPPMSNPPMSNPPMSHPRSQSLQRTVPGQHQRQQSSSLSFVMIVVAVAIGVFIAGIALLFVFSRAR